MKVYNRKDFMALPEGVIFCKGKPWYWETLCVKGDTLTSDFLDTCLQSIEAHDSGEQCNRYDRMLELGESYPMNDSCGRDGCFDDEDLFLVYEPDDLMQLITIFSHAMVITPQEEK